MISLIAKRRFFIPNCVHYGNCFFCFECHRLADDLDELSAGEECPNQPKDECDLLATLLIALPEAVEVIQGYAAHLEAQPSRIGRNEPCPCGSNMKFKTCCSDSHTTSH